MQSLAVSVYCCLWLYFFYIFFFCFLLD